MAWLISLVLLASAADHWTTYLCLRAPVSGWVVTEANPITAWMFQQFGLVIEDLERALQLLRLQALCWQNVLQRRIRFTADTFASCVPERF